MVVVATKDNDNEGTEMENMIEHIAPRVCHQFSINPYCLVWVCCEPEIQPGPETGCFHVPELWYLVQFNLIKLKDGTFRFKDPRLFPITEVAVRGMQAY